MPSSPPPAEAPKAAGPSAAPGQERIAKRIARAGLCSRREAEAWIAAGRVVVDSEKIQSPALVVGPEARILVDGKPLPAAEPTRLFRYHKPRGLLTTARDPEGRETIYDKLPKELPRLMPIGRLDLTSEGLLLLTNDGELKRKLELPVTGWLRRYRVRVNGRVDPAKLNSLAKGVRVDGIDYGPIRASLDRQQGDNAWLTLSLAEGKNREIRRVCEHMGYPVSRLIRIAYGPFQLGHLEKGEVEEVQPKVLREQLGLGGRSTDQSGRARPKEHGRDSGREHKPPKRADDRKRDTRKPHASGQRAPGPHGPRSHAPGPHAPGPHAPGPHAPGPHAPRSHANRRRPS
jgi:23S rRNA pseudouridine2605 synthase